MEGLVRSIHDGYNYLFVELPNPVTKNWFLVGRPYQIFSLIAIYLIFATRLGPWYMRNKRPYDLKHVIKYYNLFQIVASVYLFIQGVLYIFSKEFSFLCQNVDDPTTPRAQNIAISAYCFFMLKIVDLLDTAFFVLRKSERQITSLHLHHHTLMPLATWVGVTYFPGGQAAIMACVNSFVHAVMYGYYYIAGLGHKYKKYLWWKRHVTELQLAQFIIVGVHAFRSLFYECGYPMWIKIGMIMYAGIFINMFGQFYYNCYIVRRPQQNRKNKLSKEGMNGQADSGTSNGFKNEKETNSETSKNNYRNGKDAKAKISNGLKNNFKTQ